MPDSHSSETRSYNMSRIRSKETKPEVLVRKYLYTKGFRYRKNDNRYPGKPDIILPKYKTAIFINGCFWHMHEGCSDFVMPETNKAYWEPKLRRNHQKDTENKADLEMLGWKVIVVWECELKKDMFERRMIQLLQDILMTTLN